MKKLLLVFTISLAIIGCSDSGDSPTAPTGGGGLIDTVSFATDIAPLITGNSCLNSGCHGNGSSTGGFSFGSASYNAVMSASGTNGSLIIAGNAASSNFYLKLTATPPFGSRMPLGRTALSTTELDKIKAWINDGALDN